MKRRSSLRRHWFPIAIVAGFPIYALLHSDATRSCAPLPGLIPTSVAADLPTAKTAAPSWELTSVEGTKISSDEFAGKTIVLNFWGTWCPPCREEIPTLVELQKEFADQNLQVIGIAIENDPSGLGTFVDRNEINYPIALGDGKVLEAYGAGQVFPTTFFISPDGRIASYVEGALPYEAFKKATQALLK